MISEIGRLRNLIVLPLAAAAVAGMSTYSMAANTWDGGATFAGWRQANNWDNNGIPTFNNATVLTFSTANWSGVRNGTAIEANTTVRGINIGQGWATAGAGIFQIMTKAADNTAGFVLTFSSNSGNAFVNVTAAADGAIRPITIGANATNFLGSISLANNLDVTNSSTVSTITFNRPINGGFGFSKLGVGTMILDMAGSGTNYGYTGATAVSAGALQVNSAANINSTSGITVAAGAGLVYNSATALTKSLTLNGSGTGSRATLSGTGSINVAVGLNDLGDVLSPGNSPGILTFGTSQSWTANTYQWELNDWGGAAAGTNFDQIAVTGGLTLSASGTYQLDLISLTGGNTPGTIPNYVDQDKAWTIVTTTGGITGFDASKWNINTAAFTGVTGTSGRTFSVQQVGNSIELVYAVPEPSAIAVALGGVACLGWFIRRRRAA